MNFSKYSAAGNDFILIDNRTQSFPYDKVAKLCARQEGVGADGVILWEEGANVPLMRIFNADGSEAEMCGNGLRAFVQFLQEKGLRSTSYSIQNIQQKLYTAWVTGPSLVKVKIANPTSLQWNIALPFLPPLHYLDTGVPHAVLFLDDIERLSLSQLGKQIRHHPFFQPRGTNVNFATKKEKGLSIRTYERGVEAETLACGTGAIASALAAAHNFQIESPIDVHVRSDTFLTVSFEKEGEHFTQVTLEGPAKKIFEGCLADLLPDL